MYCLTMLEMKEKRTKRGEERISNKMLSIKRENLQVFFLYITCVVLLLLGQQTSVKAPHVPRRNGC